MNVLVLDVYRVIYLLVGLCWVWCSTSSDSEEVCAHSEEYVLYSIDEAVGQVVHLLEFHIIQEKRICEIKSHNIRQCLGQVIESKETIDQGLSQTDNDCFGPIMKEYERIVGYSPSLVAREVLIHKSVVIIAHKLLSYIKGGLDGKCVCNKNLIGISNIVAQVSELKTIKLDHRTLETQLKSSELKRTATEIEEKIAKIEIKVIDLAKDYDLDAFYIRWNEVEDDEEELTQLLKKDGLTAILELLQKSEAMARSKTSDDMRELVAGVEAAIYAIRAKIQELESDEKPTSNISKSHWAISETISQQKRHKDKRALKIAYLKSLKSQLFSIMDQLNNSQVSYLTICSKESNSIRYDLSTCDSNYLNLGLDGEGCTIDLTDEQGRLLKKLQKSSSCEASVAVWRLFDVNEVNNPRKYELSITTPKHDDMLSLSLHWDESELLDLLGALKKISKISLNVKSIEIRCMRAPASLFVLAQLLTMFENPTLSAMNSPFEIWIEAMCRDIPSSVPSFDNAIKRRRFRKQIEKIDRSRYIINLTVNGLTTAIKKFVWPLVTHFPTSLIDLYYPNMDKIDFLDDVNWIDQFTLGLELDYQKDTIVSLGARTAKGKVLPTCKYLTIITRQVPESTNFSKVYVVNLDGYLQPKSSNETDNVLTTKILLSIDVLVSYAVFGLNQTVNTQILRIMNIPRDHTIDDVVSLGLNLINSYNNQVQRNKVSIKLCPQPPKVFKQLNQFNYQLLAPNKSKHNFNLLT
ncbi:hypothetical protein NEHOM01_2496, partial [Nematocida homosporus]|uniref:uncharacterized protein n=1 Tax=Nematocida homosporus TaxID=1912981 RepID=UPI002220721E